MKCYRLVLGCVLSLIVFQVGCVSYTTPGPGADLRAFGVTEEMRRAGTDEQLQALFDRQPLAKFPCRIVVARVQGSGYQSYRQSSYGSGQYSVVTTRDVETEAHFQRIGQLPMVQGVAPVSRLLLGNELKNDEPLRHAAARLHGDMLLIYTFDTQFYVGGSGSPIDVVTLGFLPTRQARVTCTASAVLLDTRSGYIYGLAEASVQQRQGANSWTSRAAVDQARQRAERQAFDDLLDELEQTWRAVIRTHAQPSAAPSAAAVR